MIKNYFKIAWRSLWKHRQTTLINIGGLTIGMAAAVMITLWVQNEMSFDGFHQDADRIYAVKATIAITKTESWKWESSPYLLSEFAKRQLPEIENVTRVQPLTRADQVLHYQDKAFSENKCAYVDGQWFNFFHYDFKDGDAGQFLQNPNSMIMTASAAKKYFGTGDAIGKVIRIDTINYQVTAVVKDNPANSSFQFDFLMPVASRMADSTFKKNTTQWGNYEYITFYKLKPGSNTKHVGKMLDVIMNKNHRDNNGSFSLVNLKDIHFDSDIQNAALERGDIKTVKVFGILALVLILTACINYVNLTTARASVRAKEVSVRKIVGAGRMQLFGQFMAESFLVSVLSLFFAIILVQVSLPVFNSITDKNFAQPLSLTTTWFILLGTLLASFILNGLYPAVLLSSFKPMSVFRGKSLATINDSVLRRTLVIIQFSLSVVLIVCTIVIYRQLNYMQKINLGYDRSHIFTFRVSWWRIHGITYKKSNTFLSAIRNELNQQTQFTEVSQSNSPIVNFTNSSSGNFDWAGRPKDFNPTIAPFTADINFAHLVQLKMASGHWFTNADKHNVILNETAVKELNILKPVIGQRFYFRGDTGMVIGVAKDFYFRTLHEKISPMVIDNGDKALSTFYIKTKPGNDEAAIAAARNVWHKFIPEQPFEFNYLDDSYDKLYLKEQKLSELITFFAAIAILVSALGLLGLAAFAAQQKVKEIGIRKILGASIQNIVTLLSTDFVKMVVIASIISFPIAWWAMDKWLTDFAYRVSLSWWIFMLAGCIALFIALITVSIEAVKAALINPVKSLRSE